MHYGGNRGPTTLHGGLIQFGVIMLFFGVIASLAAGPIGIIVIILGVLMLIGGIYVWTRRPMQPPTQYGAQPGYGYQQPPYGAPPQYGYQPPPQPGMPPEQYYGGQSPPQYPPPGQY